MHLSFFNLNRATMLAVDTSNLNEYTISSSLSETSPASMDHNRRLINEIIDSTFNEQKGICEISSSQCSSMKLNPSEYSYDKRLKYWKDVLKERENISVKIRHQTNKQQSDILYNRLVTIEERDKFTIKRLIDVAQRVNPTNISTRQPLTLKEICDTEVSRFIPDLQETLPQMERRKCAQIEIIGLPKVVQEEMLGKPKWQGSRKPFNWLESKHLEHLIEENRDDIERVLEYYPDTEKLQVVGESIFGAKVYEHNSEIQIMPCKDISRISLDIPFEDEVQSTIKNNLGPEPIDFSFKINDQEFIFTNSRFDRNFITLTNFKCYPFQTEVKKVFTIQNIGRKVLTFAWVSRPFYAADSNLLKCNDQEFVFDKMPFRLCNGEEQEVFVMFQPRRVGIVRSKWILSVTPRLFKCRLEGIVMNLSGMCAVPPEYGQKIQKLQQEVIDKSNRKMIRELTNNLSTFAADIQPCECICPYQRCLNRIELFEQINSDFKCERYNDLELLEDLYKRTKKPREKMWDLKVETVKSSILKVPHAEARALFFNELCVILDTMKGNKVDLETKICQNPESYRNRLLYVRGIFSAVIDDWMDLVSTVEETFYQTSLQNISEDLEMQNAAPLKINEFEKILTLPQEESAKRQYVVEKRVRKLKPYRDTLYMQTYTLLCDFVQNIVNVIESTA